MAIDTCLNKEEKILKNYSRFALREDKSSLSSLVSHITTLSHSRHVFALSLLQETSTQHARKYHPPEENQYDPKVTYMDYDGERAYMRE